MIDRTRFARIQAALLIAVTAVAVTVGLTARSTTMARSPALGDGGDGGAAGIADCPVIESIQLEQIDWDMDATGQVPNSEYAHLELLVQTCPTGLCFLNIVGRSKLNPTDTAWLVVNMPILPGTAVGDVYPTCRTVDLTRLGVQRGQDVTGLPVLYTAVFTPVPLADAPPFGPLPDGIDIGQRVYSFGRELIQPLTGLIPPIAPNRVPWNGDTSSKLRLRFGMPNPNQGRNQCGPAALANSFHWMQSQYPDAVDLGGQTWAETLQKFKEYTDYSTCCGISQKDAVEGKLRFAQDEGKTFTPGLRIKYQADHSITDLDREKVVVGDQKARRNGPSQKPTFAWLLSELQAGEDVEVSIDWLDADGNKTGGHVVSVSGIGFIGNKMFVWTHDDGTQATKTSDDGATAGACCMGCTCTVVEEADCGGHFLGAGTVCDQTAGSIPQNGGTRTYLAHQVTIENGGYMRFGGFAQNNRIKAIYSESVGEPYLAADADNDGDVDVDDLLTVVLGWGDCPPAPLPCPGDVNGDDMVDVDDLIRVILGWTGTSAPAGACCLPDGVCVDGLTALQCEDQGGAFQGGGTSCADVVCPQPAGACCFADGSCLDGVNGGECGSVGGAYQGDGTTCSDVTCPGPAGACCLPDGTCVDQVTAQECDDAAGAYQGDATTCAGGSCQVSLGACCFEMFGCQVLAPATCAGLQGLYQGNGTTCTPNPCPDVVGACCLASGTCAISTQGSCEESGGVFQGENTSCAPNPCQPAVACQSGASLVILEYCGRPDFDAVPNGALRFVFLPTSITGVNAPCGPPTLPLGGGTTTTRYTVQGNDLQQVSNNIFDAASGAGPLDETDNRRYAGSARLGIGYDSQITVQEGRINVQITDITWSTTITLPNWTRPDGTPPAQIMEWNRFRDALNSHEKGHAAINDTHMANVETRLESMPAGRVNVPGTAVPQYNDEMQPATAADAARAQEIDEAVYAVIYANAAIAALEMAQTNYDAPQSATNPTGTNHGATQGATLNTNPG